MKLQIIFDQLLVKYTNDLTLIEKLLQEIETAYTHKKRFYHNLTHLAQMIAVLEPLKFDIAQYDLVLFSIFYHDFVYKATEKQNEEKSALIAKDRLTAIGLSEEDIDTVRLQIIATKAHKLQDSKDSNYLIDADLSILGKDWDTYFAYTNMIRKEYSIYPDILYKPGRRKVLEHFLADPQIFKTPHFANLLEQKARENIQKEIQLLK